MITLAVQAKDMPHMTIANHGPIHKIHKLLETRDVGIFYSRMLPRAALPLEVHKFVEVIYRLKGTTRMKIGDEYFDVTPGDYVIVPTGVWHQSTSMEDDIEVEQLVLCAYNQDAGSLLHDHLGFSATPPL